MCCFCFFLNSVVRPSFDLVSVHSSDVCLHGVLGLEVLAAELARVVDLHVLCLDVPREVVLLLPRLAAAEAREQSRTRVLPDVALSVFGIGWGVVPEVGREPATATATAAASNLIWKKIMDCLT